MTRRKSTAQIACASIEEATVSLNSFARLSADIAAIEAERAIRRAEVDKDCDDRIAHRAELLRSIFLMLKPWWSVAGAELAKSRKSIELGGCTIGIRTSTPKLKVKGTVASRIAALLSADYLGLIRTKHTLDKPAILKVFADGDAESPALADLTELGFSASQSAEFFIAPLAEKPEKTEVIA